MESQAPAIALALAPNCLYKGQLAAVQGGTRQPLDGPEHFLRVRHEARVERHGRGCQLLLDADGRVLCGYRGEWAADRPEGAGRMLYADGSEYEGEFRAGRRHGHGRISTASHAFSGTWADGRAHGFGVFTRQGLTLEGAFCLDNFVNAQGCHVHPLDPRAADFAAPEEQLQTRQRLDAVRRSRLFCRRAPDAAELQRLCREAGARGMALLAVPSLASPEVSALAAQWADAPPALRVDLNALFCDWRAGAAQNAAEMLARAVGVLAAGGFVLAELDAPDARNPRDIELYWPSLPAEARKLRALLDPAELSIAGGGVLLATRFRPPRLEEAAQARIVRDRFAQLLHGATFCLAFLD